MDAIRASSTNLLNKITIDNKIDRKQNLNNRDAALKKIGEWCAGPTITYLSKAYIDQSQIDVLNENIGQLACNYSNFTLKTNTLSHVIAYTCMYRKFEGKLPSNIEELNRFIAKVDCSLPRLDNGYLTTRDLNDVKTRLNEYLKNHFRYKYDFETKDLSLKGHNLEGIFSTFDFRESTHLNTLNSKLSNHRIEMTTLYLLKGNKFALDTFTNKLIEQGYKGRTLPDRNFQVRQIESSGKSMRQVIFDYNAILDDRNFSQDVANLREKENARLQEASERERVLKAQQNENKIKVQKEIINTFLAEYPRNTNFNKGHFYESNLELGTAIYEARHRDEQYVVKEPGRYCDSYGKDGYVSRCVRIIKTEKEGKDIQYTIKDEVSGNIKNNEISNDPKLVEKFGLGVTYYTVKNGVIKEVANP